MERGEFISLGCVSGVFVVKARSFDSKMESTIQVNYKMDPQNTESKQQHWGYVGLLWLDSHQGIHKTYKLVCWNL